MKRWLRRIRAALVTGMTWGVAWFSAGMVLLLIVGFGAADVPFPLGFGLLGFFAGTVFSGVLGFAEHGRRIEQMSLPRFALWGAVGGLLLSGIFVTVVGLAGAASLDLVMMGPIFALAGAGSAAGSLALARLGDDRDGHLADPPLQQLWNPSDEGEMDEPPDKSDDDEGNEFHADRPAND